MTFTITSVGTLSIAVPTNTISLGTEAAPGTTAGTTLSTDSNPAVTGSSPTPAGFGPVTVLDNRSLDPADWTATVACSDFTTAVTPIDTIPATDATYDSNGVTAAGAGFGVGTITDDSTPTILGLTNAAKTIVSETGDDGDNGATWIPTIVVTIPAHAVVGVYTGTVTHSVS